MRTPSQPRRVVPNSRNCPSTFLAMLEGIENPMPMLPPDGDRIAVLMPMTAPSISNSGPPELPRLIGASV